MKYIYDKNIFFIHIPKCAGISVGKAIDEIARRPDGELCSDLDISIDTLNMAVTGIGYVHPHLGTIHPVHIPLPLLKGNFPATWDLFISATSFAIVRDPRDRFISALMQRLLEFKKSGALRLEDDIVHREAEHVCGWLEGREVFCDLEYIHFTRQTDYTHLNGKQLASFIFPIERTDAMAAWLARDHDTKIELIQHHTRRQPRKWVARLRPAVHALARNGLPTAFREAIYPLWAKGFFVPAASQYSEATFTPDVEAFICRYYAEDAALYRSAQDRAVSTMETAS